MYKKQYIQAPNTFNFRLDKTFVLNFHENLKIKGLGMQNFHWLYTVLKSLWLQFHILMPWLHRSISTSDISATLNILLKQITSACSQGFQISIGGHRTHEHESLWENIQYHLHCYLLMRKFPQVSDFGRNLLLWSASLGISWKTTASS